MAIGTKGTSTLVERWNGTTWAIVPSPNPKGAQSNALTAVSCPTASACFAVGVGAFASGHANDRTFMQRWNGSVWNMQASPVGASVSPLQGVACASPTLCFAAGAYEPAGLPTTRAFLEQWNGTAWVPAVTPVPTGVTATGLNDVACVSKTFCVAVGNATAGSPQTLIEQWNGSSWTIAPVAVAGSLAGVACADASHCMAVGASGENTLIEQWDGSHWTTASGAVPGSLSSVSCADAFDCMAVGIINSPDWPVLQWDGASWNTISGAAPDTSGNHDITPTSVSCTGNDDCMLIGSFRNYFDYSIAYAAHWDGAVWSLFDVPTPGFGVLVHDIACTSGADCTAVGSYYPGHGGTSTWVEHWDGAGWTVATSPDPPAESPPGSALTSVACAAAGKCFAVGWWVADANTRTLIERFA